MYFYIFNLNIDILRLSILICNIDVNIFRLNIEKSVLGLHIIILTKLLLYLY